MVLPRAARWRWPQLLRVRLRPLAMRSAAPLPILLLAVAVAIVGAVRDDPQVLGVNEPGFLDAQAEITEVLSEPGAEEALGSSPVLEGEALAATGGFGSSASATGSVGATGSMGVPSATGAPGWVDIIALNPGELGAPCLGQETRGTCKPAHQCSTGTVVPDLCLTGLGIECCLPLPDTACRCALLLSPPRRWGSHVHKALTPSAACSAMRVASACWSPAARARRCPACALALRT